MLARLPRLSRLDQGNEAEPGDLGDLRERLAEFGRRVVLESRGELLDDARAIEPLDRDNERESELRIVGGVERLKPCEFLGRASVEARTRLLLRRIVSELAANRRLAGKLRVRAQEFELARLAQAVDSRDHRCVQRVGARKGPHVPRSRSDPRRVFENATQQRDEGTAIERIDGGQSHFRVQARRVAIRCHAMCARRSIEMSSCRCIKEAGEKLFYHDAAAATTLSEDQLETANGRVADAIKSHVEAHGLKAAGLIVTYDGMTGTVTVYGIAPDQRRRSSDGSSKVAGVDADAIRPTRTFW
jgi:hypothetical protein